MGLEQGVTEEIEKLLCLIDVMDGAWAYEMGVGQEVIQGLRELAQKVDTAEGYRSLESSTDRKVYIFTYLDMMYDIIETRQKNLNELRKKLQAIDKGAKVSEIPYSILKLNNLYSRFEERRKAIEFLEINFMLHDNKEDVKKTFGALELEL